jgi:CRP-like cAMP-binding protein
MGEAANEPDERLRYALLPENAVISVICLLQEGRTIEVASIGKEGISGVAAVIGVDQFPYRYIVNIPGDALRIGIRDLGDLADAASPLRRRLLRYYVAFTSQVMQNVACAGLHSLEQRCCRWLLTTHDRSEFGRFPMTHEVLATLLGTRRSSVSDVLKKLRDRRLIEYHRGLITILDPSLLERRSCECYRSVARIYDRILDG